MSGKLDRALDDIVKDRRSNPRRSTRRSTRASKPAAPVTGGVTKNSRATKSVPKKAVPTGPSNTGPSKIIVSNLPTDVNEAQIKDYFASQIGPVKKCLLTYGPNGQSRGVATVIFADSKAASRAAFQYDGTKVDGRPMKVEVVLTAKDAPTAPAIKALAERISQKSKKDSKKAPKSAAADAKTKTNGKRTARGRNAGRGKPKTADELDAEMKDYFDAGTNGAVNNTTQPVAAGGDDMDADVL